MTDVDLLVFVLHLAGHMHLVVMLGCTNSTHHMYNLLQHVQFVKKSKSGFFGQYFGIATGHLGLRPETREWWEDVVCLKCDGQEALKVQSALLISTPHSSTAVRLYDTGTHKSSKYTTTRVLLGTPY